MLKRYIYEYNLWTYLDPDLNKQRKMRPLGKQEDQVFDDFKDFYSYFQVFTFLKGALLEMQIEILKNEIIRYLRFA